MRSRMNALVSQPLVGMIDGVAARRARFLDSESYASFSDRTRMLARRASASTSARAASACCPPGPSALRLSRSDHMPAGPPMPACCTVVSVGVSPASKRSSCSRWPNRCSVSRSPVMRSRIRWISSASRRFSFSSARLCVMFTPREMAATPSTRKGNATTLPMPTSALTKVCDTSTARDDPQPCGTTMTVQRRSAFLRIRSPRPRIKTVSAGTEKAPAIRTCQRENPDRAWGPVPECGPLKYGLTGKPSTRREVSQITILRGFRRGLPGLGEEDGWLFHSPPGRVQGLQVAQPDPRQGRGGGGSQRGPHRFGGSWNERLCQHRDPGDGAGQVREHGVELGALLRLLHELVRRPFLHVAVPGGRH